MKVVLAGPPRSGKSCLREGLKQAIHAFKQENSDVPYPYVITACPDGEGAWFQETMAKYPKVGEACKNAYKTEFTPEFVKLVAGHVDNCTEALTLVDIGGLVSEENKKICKGASHIVILAGNEPIRKKTWMERMKPWQQFAEDLNLKVVAEICSDYSAKKDVVEKIGSDNILRGKIHCLERGKSILTRPMVQTLALHILKIGGYKLMGKILKATYTINRDKEGILHIGFGKPSDNDQIVKDTVTRLDEMVKTGELSGGGLLKVNGPASLPVAMVLGHKLSHLFQAIACFDPKLDKYVVVISHSPEYSVGELIV